MIDEVHDKGAGWSEHRSYGTWTGEDGRRFCVWCNKVIRVGDRVEEHTTHPHRGGRGRHAFFHVGTCPTKGIKGKG